MDDAGNNLTSQDMRRIANRWRQTADEMTSNSVVAARLERNAMLLMKLAAEREASTEKQAYSACV
jgi:hypothetical protein